MVSIPDNCIIIISDHTNSNFLVYNLQHPHITSNFLMVTLVIMVATVMVVLVVSLDMLVLVAVVNMVVIVVMVVMVVRTG